MRVLFIDVNCKYSSTGKIVYDLYNAVNKNGDETAICYGRGEKIKEKNIFKFGLDIETYAHAFLTRITGFTGCFSPISTWRLLRFIKKFKPDVVHVHELHAYFVNIVPLFKYLKRHNIKTVCTLHCEFMYTGKCGHSVDCERWKTECEKCPHLKDYPSSMFFDHTKYMFREKKKHLAAISDLTIVTPSEWLANRCKKSFLGDREIHVVHNGIDTETFSPQDTTELKRKHNISEDEKVVLAVAPNIMSENKGGRHVLALAEKMKDESVRFILIGADEEVKCDNPRVEVLGRIYDKELLAQYYSMADVFVICSERENFPTTCIEAQCCGTPVCGFENGGGRETKVSDYGDFVSYADVDALRSIVVATLSVMNTEKRKEIRKIAEKEFSSKAMAEKYLILYGANV